MATRKEQREAAREERRRREREAAAAAKRRQRIRYAIGGVLAVAAIAGIAIAAATRGGGSSQDLSSYYPRTSIAPAAQNLSLSAAAKAAGCTIQTHPAEGHNHTTAPVHYGTNPPSSGDHDPVPASDGAYVQAPGIGHLVHALEHGRVLIWFKPSALPVVRGQLKAVFDEDPSLLLLTPNETGMLDEVAASAWTGDLQHGGTTPEVGHVLGCPQMNQHVPDALRAFIASYRGQGPEHVTQPE